ncbi:hypothetical protein ABGB16_12515 [Micromonospora sp. B11E3]|uniref:hypothetical protein n=1 Tax=Micromonospora sp. B11E3 TaxID=3153562 RepID=UPI00325E3039
MRALIGHPPELVWVGLKTVLLYLTAVAGFRISRRRTVGEVSPYDFVAAVAVGAIVGRLPSAPDASYLAGMVTLLALLLVHAPDPGGIDFAVLEQQGRLSIVARAPAG